MWEKVCMSVKVPRLEKALRSVKVPRSDLECRSVKASVSGLARVCTLDMGYRLDRQPVSGMGLMSGTE